jgi:hypothetical protein
MSVRRDMASAASTRAAQHLGEIPGQFFIASAAASLRKGNAKVGDRFRVNRCGRPFAPRAGRASSAENFPAPTIKDFFNSIDPDIHHYTIWLALTLRVANGLREADELVFA